MAGDVVNVPLLLRTAQTLRDRFAALRDLGPLAAVMEESPRDGLPARDGKAAAMPPEKLPFRVGTGTALSWRGGAVVTRAGQMAATRGLWLGGAEAAVSRLRRVCRDANGFVPFVRKAYGLSADCGTDSPNLRWIWTVFELAEIRPSFTVLALDGLGEVFRCSESGCTASEGVISEAESMASDQDPFLQLVRREKFHPQRYWQLDDLVEASISVMDLIEVAVPSLAGDSAANGPTVEGSAEVGPHANDAPEDTTRKGGRRHKRTVEDLNVDQWVLVMAAKDPTFRHLSQRAAAKLGTFGARTIGRCEMWIQMKAQIEREAIDKAEAAKAELADRRGEDEDANGLRVSSTKHRIGFQRATREDLEHDRQVEDFLRAKGKNPRRKRAK